jgi:Histidine kinase-, DNA gyrase B-, and HSP90-like ATPase
VGETRVDLQHLLEDLRDAYTGTLEETILTEILANALDSGAATIRLTTNVTDATLTVADDGHGMQRRQLSRYHDVAASTKARGEGIGFAGVGIKLGLLASREVITETRRGATHVATRWHLASRHRAPWKWIPAPGMAAERGTAVRLALSNPLSPLLDPGYLEHAIRRHFAPLLDPTFNPVLSEHYPNGVAFDVDGRRVHAVPIAAREIVPVEIRLGRRRKPSAIGFLALHEYPLPEDECGVGISTYGKVIKRGWEWLGLAPAIPNRVNGLVEIPDLAACLTLNKSDVFRTGPRAASYLAYRKALQEVVSRQLAVWGDSRNTTESRPRTERLERDLQRVLDDLLDDFPLLNSLVERRAGGQKRLPLPGRGPELVPGTLFAKMADVDDASVASGSTPGSREREQPAPSESTPQSQPSEPETRRHEGLSDHPAVGAVGHVHGRRRPARSALVLRFEARPDDPELGRLVENAIWINEAHPAYLRATESRSLGYHIAVTVALALAPLAVGAADEHAFLTQFLAYWGSSEKKVRIAQRRGRSR